MFDMILLSSVGNETSKTVLNFLGGAEQEAWEYMAVCVPIVVLCAPMGSLIASYFHRQGNICKDSTWYNISMLLSTNLKIFWFSFLKF